MVTGVLPAALGRQNGVLITKEHDQNRFRTLAPLNYKGSSAEPSPRRDSNFPGLQSSMQVGRQRCRRRRTAGSCEVNEGCRTGGVNPHGLRVGYRRVRVGVDILLPDQNPYPTRG